MNKYIFIISIVFSLAFTVNQTDDYIENAKTLYNKIYEDKELNSLTFEIDMLDTFDLKKISNQMNQEEIKVYLSFSDTITSNKLKKFWISKKVNLIKGTKELQAHDIRYKNAFYGISKPLFNKNYTKATVRITYHCGMYCSYSELNIYTMNKDGWYLTESLSKSEW